MSTDSTHIPKEAPSCSLQGRCYVIGVNLCLHLDQTPADFSHRDRVWAANGGDGGWVEPGNSVIVHPTGRVLAGPAKHQETILYADVDLAAVHAAGRFFDPVGHYSRRDIPAPGGHQLPTSCRHVRPSARRDACGTRTPGPGVTQRAGKSLDREAERTVARSNP